MFSYAQAEEAQQQQEESPQEASPEGDGEEAAGGLRRSRRQRKMPQRMQEALPGLRATASRRSRDASEESDGERYGCVGTRYLEGLLHQASFARTACRGSVGGLPGLHTAGSRRSCTANLHLLGKHCTRTSATLAHPTAPLQPLYSRHSTCFARRSDGEQDGSEPEPDQDEDDYEAELELEREARRSARRMVPRPARGAARRGSDDSEGTEDEEPIIQEEEPEGPSPEERLFFNMPLVRRLVDDRRL